MSDPLRDPKDVIADEIWPCDRHDAKGILAALQAAGYSIVNRADLELALGMIDDEWTGTNVLGPVCQPIFDRLDAVLDEDGRS